MIEKSKGDRRVKKCFINKHSIEIKILYKICNLFYSIIFGTMKKSPSLFGALDKTGLDIHLETLYFIFLIPPKLIFLSYVKFIA